MLTIKSERLTIGDFYHAVFQQGTIEIDPSVLSKVDKNFQFLKTFAKDKILYGINTGFGPMAQYRIEESESIQLQLNLIRSHASGSGVNIDPLSVRAIMLARLNSLSKGYSGIHTSTLEVLKSLINHHVTPTLYEHGGVGASGDLVQLAHLTLNLIGEGEVYFENKKQPALEVFKKLGIKPLRIHCREGLALINGTSAMTGIGLVNLIHAKNLLYWSILISSMINEIVQSFDDHFSEPLNNVKPHTGQQKVASIMREYLKDSTLIDKRHQQLFKKTDQEVFEKKVQEYYSLRCVPQILGPVSDAIDNAEEVLLNELNSVNDNPIVDSKNDYVFHGGNFHGDYVSFEMDKLKIAISKLCILAERQINFLVNKRINRILPPFLNKGKLGLNLGVQGMVFTATSTTAENQTLSYPMYLHSIPNNNDNQDVVSMGANSAQIASKVINNAYTILAIELICILQAIDVLSVKDKLSTISQQHYQALRKISKEIVNDRPLYKDIERVEEYLKNNYINGL